MDLLDATIVTVAAPSVKADLHATDGQIQWIVAAYILAIGSGLITGGRLGDQYGHKRVFLVGVAAFGLASTGCALAADPGTLIAARAVQGLIAGLMVPQVFGIIRSSFPPAAAAAALGAFGAMQGVASVAGPLLGGAIVHWDIGGLGWRPIFWINVPVAIVAVVAGVRALPESHSASRQRLDLRGVALSVVSVVLLLLPLVQGREWGWPWWGYVIMAVGGLTFAFFLAVERRLERAGGAPIFPPGLLRRKEFSAGLGASLLVFGTLSVFFLTLSVYLQVATGRDAWQTGLVLVPYALGSMLTVALAAKAARALLVSGAVVLAVGHAGLWWVIRDGLTPAYWALFGPLLVGGLGLGLVAPILFNTTLSAVPGRDAGSAGGVLSTVNQIAGAIGIATLGTVYFSTVDSRAAGGALRAFSDALSRVLMVEIVLYLAAAVLMVFLPVAVREGQGRSAG